MARLFLGGIPTKPDVDALMEEFKDLRVGDLITYERISETIRVEYGTSRFRTIVSRFRKTLLRLRNIDVAVIPKKGYRVLSANDRVIESVGDFHRGARKIRRSAQRISLAPTEELKDSERIRADHARRLIESTYSSARNASKAIAIDFKPPAQLPRGK